MSEETTKSDPASGDRFAGPPVINIQRTQRGRRMLWLLVPLLLLPVVSLLFVFNPAQNSFYPFCVFYKLTGLQCPGCGGLRAAHQLLHGHLLTAFRFNPLVVGALPFLLILLVSRWRRGPGRPISSRTMAMWAWIAFVVLVAFWIVRNLPIAFFQLPPG